MGVGSQSKVLWTERATCTWCGGGHQCPESCCQQGPQNWKKQGNAGRPAGTGLSGPSAHRAIWRRHLVEAFGQIPPSSRCHLASPSGARLCESVRCGDMSCSFHSGAGPAAGLAGFLPALTVLGGGGSSRHHHSVPQNPSVHVYMDDRVFIKCTRSKMTLFRGRHMKYLLHLPRVPRGFPRSAAAGVCHRYCCQAECGQPPCIFFAKQVSLLCGGRLLERHAPRLLLCQLQLPS